MSVDSNLSSFSMLDLFRAESQTHAAAFLEALALLEQDPARSQPMEPLMRAAHSIKGAAKIVKVESAALIAGCLEEAVVDAMKGTVRLKAEDLSVLKRAAETLKDIAAANEADFLRWLPENSTDVATLIENLKRIAAGKVGSDKAGPDTIVHIPQAVIPAAPAKLITSKSVVPVGKQAEISLIELFREEVRQYATMLNDGLVELEADVANPQLIEPLMRAAHSIKGAARIVNIEAAVQVAHVMEDVFVAAQQGRLRLTSSDIDLLLQGVDLLTSIAEGSEEDARQWLPSMNAGVGRLIAQLTIVAEGTAADTISTGASSAGMAVANPSSVLQSLSSVSDSPSAAEPVPPESRPDSVPVVATPRTAHAPQPTMVLSAASVIANREELLASGGTPADERVVRVTAQSLSRLMSLAGESLVEARWLQPFAKSLLSLKQNQDHLAGALDEIQQSLSGAADARQMKRLLLDARQRITACRRLLADRIGEFETHARQSDDLNSRLYHEVIASRMRPFADGVQGFPRMVRDLARQLGKKLKFEIHGHSTDVDRDILEKLEAPLNHLLRNALDHGLESPEQRASAGKAEHGTLRLEARHRAGMLSITVSDDGRGISLERLRRKIVEKGLTTSEAVSTMNEVELLSFLFLPGFSTTERVTEVSGRGVGLDVVHNMVTAVGGSVRVTSKFGTGTTFHLQLPITLSVLRAVLATIGDEPYAFPHNRIDRLLRLRRDEMRTIEGRQYFTVDGRNVGLVMSRQVFDLAASERPSDELCVVLISDHHAEYGAVVDSFRGEQDLVVRPLDRRLGKVPNISAAALLDDGAPVLIVDVDDFARSIDNLLQAGRLRRANPEADPTAAVAKKRILVVDDSITVREAEKQLLVNRGYEVEVAVDGMDGWNTVRDGDFDLVVSDIDMPRMNGLEFVRNIKQDARLKDTPVVIVSYKGREEDRLKGLEAGADYYLTKSSFHDDTLLDAVTDLIGDPT